MSEYFFGLHSGHLSDKANRIAKKHGAGHVNYIEPGTNEKRGWFYCHNQGSPYDQLTADAVMEDIEEAGGLESMMLR